MGESTYHHIVKNKFNETSRTLLTKSDCQHQLLATYMDTWFKYTVAIVCDSSYQQNWFMGQQPPHYVPMQPNH